MAVDLPFLPGIAHDFTILSPALFIYTVLIATVALTAVFTSKPARRRAALDVLRLLLPRRSRDQTQIGIAPPPSRHRESSTGRRRLPPANP
jgi:hypothetical protein